MTKGKILGDIHQIDKDVELCRTTNERISNQAAQLLIENQIPFCLLYTSDAADE